MSNHGGRRNGAGRPRGQVSEAKKQIAELMAEYVPAAIETIGKAAEGGDLVAAREILDRVYGKPTQALQHEKTRPDCVVILPAKTITKDMTPKEAADAYA